MKYEVKIRISEEHIFTVDALTDMEARVKGLREAQKGFSGGEEYEVVDCEQIESPGERETRLGATRMRKER